MLGKQKKKMKETDNVQQAAWLCDGAWRCPSCREYSLEAFLHLFLLAESGMGGGGGEGEKEEREGFEGVEREGRRWRE